MEIQVVTHLWLWSWVKLNSFCPSNTRGSGYGHHCLNLKTKSTAEIRVVLNIKHHSLSTIVSHMFQRPYCSHRIGCKQCHIFGLLGASSETRWNSFPSYLFLPNYRQITGDWIHGDHREFIELNLQLFDMNLIQRAPKTRSEQAGMEFRSMGNVERAFAYIQ